MCYLADSVIRGVKIISGLRVLWFKTGRIMGFDKPIKQHIEHHLI